MHVSLLMSVWMFIPRAEEIAYALAVFGCSLAKSAFKRVKIISAEFFCRGKLSEGLSTLEFTFNSGQFC